MFLCSASRIGMAAAAISAAITLAIPPPSWAQTSPPAKPAPPAPPAAPAKPDALPAAPPQTVAPEPGDAFGADATLTAKPIVYVKGKGTWDKAFETISNSLKKVKTYIDKEGLKADGLPMTIFTATDDTGFDYEAAIPIAEPPKKPPDGGIAIGQSPEGHALKFVHRGSYDALDDTYEAITNYLDEKRLDAEDMFIEQYVTDPVSSDQNKLVVNVFVLIK
jgi:effector-binding domain-containing protein